MKNKKKKEYHIPFVDVFIGFGQSVICQSLTTESYVEGESVTDMFE